MIGKGERRANIALRNHTGSHAGELSPELIQYTQNGKNALDSLKNGKMTIYSAPGILPKGITPELIEETVCRTFMIDETALKGTRRFAALVAARRVAFVLLNRYAKMTMRRIGERYGGRSHSTICVSIKKAWWWHKAKDENWPKLEKLDDLFFNLTKELKQLHEKKN